MFIPLDAGPEPVHGRFALLVGVSRFRLAAELKTSVR